MVSRTVGWIGAAGGVGVGGGFKWEELRPEESLALEGMGLQAGMVMVCRNGAEDSGTGAVDARCENGVGQSSSSHEEWTGRVVGMERCLSGWWVGAVV